MCRKTFKLKDNLSGAELGDSFGFSVSDDGKTVCFDFSVCDSDIYCPFSKDNEKLYEADVVEIFISPDGNPEKYYELEVSPSGLRFLALIYNENGNCVTHTTMIEPFFDVTTELTAKGYDVRIFVKTRYLDGFDIAAARFNAYSIDYDAGGALKTYKSLNPTKAENFHLPEFFVKF